MNIRVGINGFGRVGRCAFRSAYRERRPDRVGGNQRPCGRSDARVPVAPRHGVRAVPGCDRGRRRRARRRRHVDPGLRRDGSGCDPVVEGLGGRRARVHRQVPCTRRRSRAPRGRREQSDHLGAWQGRRCDARSGRQLRDLRPSVAQHRLERIVHDQLPRSRGEGAARSAQDPPRDDDHDPRVHRRPEAGRPAAQGSAPCPSGAANIIPTSTGAATAIGLVIPELAGRFKGLPHACRCSPARWST